MRGLKSQLEALQNREARIEEARRAYEAERKRLEKAKADGVVCPRCRGEIARNAAAAPPTAAVTSHRTLGDGQYSVASHIASLRADAIRDQEYLEKESRYLDALESRQREKAEVRAGAGAGGCDVGTATAEEAVVAAS